MALRQLLPRTISLLVTNASPVLSKVPAVRSFYYRSGWNPYPFFGGAANIFRNLEREFDRVQQQVDRRWLGQQDDQSDKSRSLTTQNNRFDQHDMIVTDSDGTRKFRLAFNLEGFEPEEVKIKTNNGMITITAKTEKKDENTYSLREFSQSYSLPSDVKLDDLQSKFTDDGILTIEAPLPKAEPRERFIQIEHDNNNSTTQTQQQPKVGTTSSNQQQQESKQQANVSHDYQEEKQPKRAAAAKN